MSINYVASNGCTCCLNTTTTQQTHPSLAFVDPNGTTNYVALTTSAIAGAPHVNISGTDYSMGVVPEEGGVRIHSNYVCIACAYNYNTTLHYSFCYNDSVYRFSLGLNPLYSTILGCPVVAWNSKNCTGSSPTIDEHIQCMLDRSTNASCLAYWTCVKEGWSYVNACIDAGCDVQPSCTSTILCQGYCICLSDNCYWSLNRSFCDSAFNNHAAWSSCSWCKGCCPIGCWSSIDYVSYDLNRTSGTMYVAGSDYLGRYAWTGGVTCCYIDYGDYDEYHTCGYRTRLTTPPKRYHVWGSVPSAVTFCSPASSYTHSEVTQVTSANSWTYSSGDQYYLGSTGYNERRIASTWTFDCTSYSYYPDINCVCLCVYCTYNAESTACVIGGRWSDGSTGWTTSYGRTITEVYNGSTCQPINCACLITRTNLGTSSKSWQNWTAPSLVHCAW